MMTPEPRTFRIQRRYDELMREGKHGHYETLFRVVNEEIRQAVAAERERCARVIEDWGIVPDLAYDLAAAIRSQGEE